jgi:flagellar hook assembly protein FlgD
LALGDVPVRFSSPKGGKAILRVFNSAGELVRVLFDGAVEVERTVDLSWDLKNQQGAKVSSGVYVLALSMPSGDKATRVLVVH